MAIKKTETETKPKTGTVQVAKKKAETVKEKGGVRIYVGCNIPGTILSYGKIYSGELPFAVKGLLERFPEAEPLIIDVDELVEFRKRVNIKGSREYELVKKLMKRIGKEN